MRAVAICKSFGENRVLADFTEDFPEGKLTAVMGSSGCGKSTLLMILMGLLPADSGSVEMPENSRISAVFQEDRLCDNLTVSANIRLVTGKKYSPAEIDGHLLAVGLVGCADKPVRELSGGMKRRTALLRALLAEYDVLFLDEPFKGLDEDTRLSVMDYTKRMTQGKTAVMVTHDSRECDFLADKVIRL